ncbi:MAG TPA: HhH-GPD-type base excision DNA repair protein [Phycicoccus sp.]|nr:HhH-GPD-type base excision DNA repair protein [Phycicoccus sp.]
MPQLHLSQDAHADAVLSADPFALVLGMLLDQQVAMEVAFVGPAKILDRFGTLDPGRIAAAAPDEFADLCATPPAVHRYARSMAGRIQSLARVVVDDYDGDVTRVWTGAVDGTDLVRRLQALPGFGAQKATIFAALLGKQLGVRPPGWEVATVPYGEPGTFRSVADIVDEASLLKVRETKRQAKAAAKANVR